MNRTIVLNKMFSVRTPVHTHTQHTHLTHTCTHTHSISVLAQTLISPNIMEFLTVSVSGSTCEMESEKSGTESSSLKCSFLQCSHPRHMFSRTFTFLFLIGGSPRKSFNERLGSNVAERRVPGVLLNCISEDMQYAY